MKLLVIEDNRFLADSLKKHLGRTFVVDTAWTGEQGLTHAKTKQHDAVILDLNLPDMAGYDICKSIRSGGSEVPILILTGNKDLGSRVSLLNAGADDYLVKPFSVAELRARLNALLRRAPAKFGPDMLAVQDLVLDPNRREVERGGKRIALRRKEFDILEYLVRNRGRAVSRSMIFDHVWESTSEKWSNTVDVHIKYLRDKIDRPFAIPLIKTAYGVGYMIDDVNVTKGGASDG